MYLCLKIFIMKFYDYNKIMKKYFYYIAGLILLIIYNLPWFINGDNAVYRIYDYLEQDFVNLSLNAKYLLSPLVTNIPELFGGTYRASIQAHSLIQIILYKFIPGSTFLHINQLLIQIVGFSGMFLLLNKIFNAEKSYKLYINTGISFLFAITPLIMHGMSLSSIPLFFWACIKIKEEEENIKILLPVLSIIIFLGLGTSLIYCGFSFVLILLLLCIYYAIKKEKCISINYLICAFIIALCYIISNIYTILSFSEISHRVEMIIYAGNFTQTILQQLLDAPNDIESPVFPYIPLGLLCITVLVGMQNKTKEYKAALYTFISIIIIAIICTSYTSLEIIVNARNHLGALRNLQLNRIGYYIAPLYYFMFASCLLFLANRIKKNKLCCIFASIIFIFQFIIIKNSSYNYFKTNIKVLQNKPVIEKTYAQFFQTELMQNVKKYINKPQESYHVVSLGINPGVPLFNGFYCLDGYSTNYRLSYKKQWKKIIHNEIIQENFFNKLFNEWGSRVYILSHEVPNYRPQELNETATYINNLDINYQVLKSLGANYLFSRYKIKNLNPALKFEKVFYSKNNKYFRLYLYSIN